MKLSAVGILLGIAVCASAQMEGWRFAADVRQKYGPALARETFTVRPGLEMIVDFAANGHVCRIQLPATAPADVVNELLPTSVRGKELRRYAEAMGLQSLEAVEYENVTVAVSSQGADRTGTSVTFKNEQCQ